MASEVEIRIKATDEYSKEFAKAGKAVENLNKTLLIASAAFTAVGGIAVKTLTDWAISASETQQVQEAFNKTVGKDASQLLAGFKSATDGAISSIEAMKTINTALTRNISKDTIPFLAKMADKLADAGVMGLDTAGHFDMLTKALATGNTRYLEQIGIQTEGIDIMSALIEKDKTLIDTKQSLSERIAEAKNNFTDLKNSIGAQLIPVFEKIIGWLERIVTWFTNLSEQQKKLIAISGIVVGALLLIAGAITVLAISLGALNLALLPVLLIVGAIILVIVAIIAIIVYWADIIAWFKEQITVFVEKVKADWNSLINAWSNVWKAIAGFFVGVWNGIISGIENGVNYIIKLINKVISAANKVPGINIPTIPNASLEGFKITQINDGVIGPGGDLISTSPQDYLFATKDPSTLSGNGGFTVNFYGDIHGADANDLAKQLSNIIRRKISI